MARGDGPHDAPEPLSRLLARSDAVARELERARERLAEMSERYDAEQPLTPEPDQDETAPLDGAIAPVADVPADVPDDAPGAPADDAPEAPPADDQPPAPVEDRSRDVVIVPEADRPDEEPSRDHDIAMLQEAARRRLSDER